MTPSDLASKIAEDVFRTIERENAIIKAEIVDAVEKVVLQWQAGQQIVRDAELLSSSPVFHGGANIGEAEHRRMFQQHPPQPTSQAPIYQGLSQQSLSYQGGAGGLAQGLGQGICAFPNCLCPPYKVCPSARPQERQA